MVVFRIILVTALISALGLVAVLDATAKPESGILDGNFQWLGSFDECKSARHVTDVEDESFSGQYCLQDILGVGRHLGLF